MGFKARKKLITRESAVQGWEGVELMTVVEWCVSGATDVRFIGPISGDSCGMIDQQT